VRSKIKILPVFIPHLGCTFACIYCDQQAITKSVIPAPSKIGSDILKFCKFNQGKEKEIAFYSGTFTNLTRREQQKYLDLVQPFLDKKTSIRISTRPDSIGMNILLFCRKNGVQTIELGIQSFSDRVLRSSKRNYNSQISISTCKLIKKFDFNLGIQLMPGLPGFSKKSLQNTISETIKLQPEFVRIYPTIVLKNTILEKWFLEKKYIPLKIDEAVQVVSEMIRRFEEEKIKVIKIGLQSDIEEKNVVSGPYHQCFGELVRIKIMAEKIIAKFERNRTLIISPADISLFKGFGQKMLNELKQKLPLEKIPIRVDHKMIKNKFAFRDVEVEKWW